MNRLKAARYDRGLTAKDLAEAADVSVDTIRDAESGRRIPGAPIAKKIADALELKPSDLFFDEPADAPAEAAA